MQEYQQQFIKLKEKLSETFSKEDIEKIEKAFAIADEAHKEQRRRSGEPYIIHPLAVATILSDMGMDTDSLCAALLHDVVEDTPTTAKEIRDIFGEDVELLVEGVTKLGQIPFAASKEEEQSENIRKMFLAVI